MNTSWNLRETRRYTEFGFRSMDPNPELLRGGLIMRFEQRLLKVSQSSKNPPEQSLDPFQMLSHQNADRSYHLLAYFNHSFKRTLLFPSLNHSGASSASCALEYCPRHLFVKPNLIAAPCPWISPSGGGDGFVMAWLLKNRGYSNCHFF